MKPGSETFIIPAATAISSSQNDFSALRLLLAQRLLYAKAKRWSFLRAIGVGVIAVLAPLVTLRWPDASVGLGALAGSWIVASRTVFVALEKRSATRAAIIQERFDTQFFGMPQVSFRAPHVTPEDVSRLVGDDERAKASIERHTLRDWYPIDPELPGEVSIAIAQRANAAYAERLLGIHATVWLALVLLWSFATLCLSLWLGLSFSTFLLGVALPLLPALLDVIDQWRLTELARGERRSLANDIERSIRQLKDAPISPEDLLRWQDQLYVLRRDSPQVPSFIYWKTRKVNEVAMHTAATELATAAKSFTH